MSGTASKSNNNANSINNANFVKRTYLAVIDDVIANIREMFLEEGYDEQLLHELKNIWQAKVQSSNAVQPPREDDEPTTSAAAVPDRADHPVVAPKSAKESAAMAKNHGATPVYSPLSLPSLASPLLSPPSVSTSTSNARKKHANIAVKSEKRDLDESAAADFAYPSLDSIRSLAPPQSVVKPELFDLDFGASPLPPPPSVGPSEIQLPVYSPATDSVVTRKPASGGGGGKKAASKTPFSQLDGCEDGSSDEDEDDDDIIDDDDDDEADEKLNDYNDGGEGREGSPLNSEDDLTNDSEKSESNLFDTDHVIVCQYDKITRNKNKWKFHLKDGIMNINGKDYLFNKLTGEAIF